MIEWLLESTVIVALLAVVITLACRLGRCSPAVCHALWLIVLAKLLLPPVVVFPWSPWRFVDESLTRGDGRSRSTGPSSEASALSVQGSGFWVQDSTSAEAGEYASASDIGALSREREEPPAVTDWMVGAWCTEKWTAIRGVLKGNVESALLYVGLLAACIIAARQAVWLMRINRLGRAGQIAPGWLRKQVAQIAGMLQVRPPRIVVVNAIRTPFVWCLGRPRLFWPAAIAQVSDPNRWRGVVAHELAHLRRRDHFIAWLTLAAEWLWWWNPVFWYVRSRLRESAELACDAWAVSALPGSRQTYAETIVEVTELFSKTALPMPALGASSGARRTFKRRLTMILCERVPSKLTWRGLIGAAVLAFLALPSWLIGPSPAADKPADDDKASKSSKEFTGHVKSVEAGNRTITVGGKQLERTLSLAKDVRVLLDDGTGDKFGFQAGQLADVAEGVPITLRLSPDQKQVVGIWVEGPTLKGVLKSVDADKPSITLSVTVEKGEPEEERTFEVSKNAKVTIAADKGKDKTLDAPAPTLADLPAGAVLVVKLSADQKTVGRVQAETPSVFGTLKSVDGAKNSLTVTVAAGKKDGPGEERTFELAEKATIVAEGAAVKLADLPPDISVSLKLSLDQKEVVGVLAEGLKLQGTLKAVDAGANKVTLHVIKVKGEPGEEHTYDVSKKVTVTIDKSGGKLSDLPTDVGATIRLSIKQKEVIAIHVEGGHLHGVVKVVDAGSRSITIAEKQGERTFTVAEEASVRVDDKEQKLADLPAEAHVFGKLSADQKTVLSLSAQGRTVHGVIRAVDSVNREITIDVPKEGESKFKLAEDVKVVSGDKAKSSVPLADLKPDIDVHLVFSADQKLVRQIVLAKD